MGNTIDRGSHESSSGIDGESIYDTIARDISYKKCSNSENEKSNLVSSKSYGMERSLERTRGSIRRSGSLKTTRKEVNRNSFRISELKVQVDGQVAILVPRNSALKRKRLSSVKSKLTFTAKPPTKNEETEIGTVKADDCKVLDTVAYLRQNKNPDLSTRRPVSLDSSQIRRMEKNNNEINQKENTRESSKTRPKSLIKKTNSNDSSKNVSNNNNINRTGNMALNMEKARLKKLAAAEQSHKSEHEGRPPLCKAASEDSNKKSILVDMKKAKLRRLASAESVFELNRRLGNLTVAPAFTEHI